MTKKTCLQNILFDHIPQLPRTRELFVRKPASADADDENRNRSSLSLAAGEIIDLGSYFNSINLGKWKQLCGLSEASLRLTWSGALKVSIFDGAGGKRKKLAERKLYGNGRADIPLPAGGGRDFISVVLEAESDGTVSDAGWYGLFPNEAAAVNPAIVICTYKRMEYLKQTLAILTDHLPAGWQILIIDNDSSVTDEFRSHYDKRFSFFNNPNTGGSGGFTRGIVEAIRCGRTHALLMDDDIILDPEALFRTDLLLKYLKQEYNERFLAGAMFRLDKPCVQHESTACWNGIKVHSLRHNLDMAKAGNIRKNAKPLRRRYRYAGWWYCCIPLSPGIGNDLPFPMFVGGDDIEYSLRRAKGFIEMNGICVWHPPFEGKNSPVRQHYLVTRNGLIINAMHLANVLPSLLLVLLRLIEQTLKRNRKAKALIRGGVLDFLKGPESAAKTGNPFEKDEGVSKSASHWLSELISRHKKVRAAYKKMKVDSEIWSRINQ